MTDSGGAALPLSRRFAIRLLHEAQVAGQQGFVAAIGAAAEPDVFLRLEPGDTPESAARRLQDCGRRLWALYLHRPEAPAQPDLADFAQRPELLRLTASLATKGVLQLRAWGKTGEDVIERELHIHD
jgi:hypothetical protein